ncbi:MAG: hypothetical protein DMF61_05560 [Blastocatellia bacterium AA13]|nr:MAG: hypothetical protein DMF61_05560 [Blastocatellia bacterium AA13]
MKIEVGRTITYNDTDAAAKYGTGVVMSVTENEYTILWARRGPTKYRRSIVDQQLSEVFKQEGGASEGAPKERHIHLGPSKQVIALNENYDRDRLALLCANLEGSGVEGAVEVAKGIAAEFTSRKFTLRPGSKKVLKALADLCTSTAPGASVAEACEISRELFFGRIIQKSDFA